MRLAATLLLAVLATACRTAAPRPPEATAPAAPVAPAPPPPAPARAVAVPEPRIALVLGGGAARGFAHIGVIRVLEQERIPVDLVVGTSVGSLIGAIYASARDSFELEWTAFQLQKDDLFDFGLVNAVVGMGYAKGDKLEAFVRAKVKQANIEQLAIPFAAVATDLNWGERVVLDRGSVARAVRASSAIPGIFEPVAHQGKILVDGGVVDNIAIDVARLKGADLVVAVDISDDVGNVQIRNVLDVLLQSTNIMFAENVKHRRQGADVLVAPDVRGVGMLDFGQKKRCMQAGMDAARRAVPQLRAAIAAWKARKAAQLAPRS
ncbi:patatin-like phospholipase family protein [Anaeromyxobacter oryzisoli]|uniref:patatin-like phospholipase family protein n=1 Tax=Anaeromyxobacter oryzisoli TaxID=2925408 RepID=UPI001F58BF2D|nr:patatin-like phospholipase family protein [Anaeromyxobacter sp. SG63]